MLWPLRELRLRGNRQLREAKVTLRQLTRRCGPLTAANTAWIQALPLAQLEALATWLADIAAATA